MDGLHKLKTPGLYASLFFQVSSIYLLFQATSLRSNSYLQENLQRRASRDAQMPMESPNRAQEIQCSEGLAAYQWGAIGSILLSVGCLSPMFMRRRSDRPAEKRSAAAQQPREPELSYRPAPAPEPEITIDHAMNSGVYKNLKKGLEELESQLKNQPTMIVGDAHLVRTVQENVRLLESRNRSAYENLIGGHEEIQKASSRLQRLMEQCRESANYAATNRVDWKKNKLVDVLAQMRQNLDTVVDLSKNVNSIHASTLRLLGECLHGETILNDKISRAQEQLERIQNGAHGGNKVHDSIINVIGESRDNITGASKFVGSMSQKWDALVMMTEQIDDVAERINAQSLAASLEMVRGQSNPGGVTDLFPLGTELRGLAAKFHTYARHIKDAIHEVRDEAFKTGQYLSQAGSKADHAFVSVNQCGEYYRGSVAAVKHSASELQLLQQEVNIHVKKLQETRVMGQNSADLLNNLDRHLSTHNGFGLKIMDETSQITVHSEKISTLLAKQYHELNHCQKILSQSAPMLSDSIRFSTESKHTITSLAASIERVQTHSGNEEQVTREVAAPKLNNEMVTKFEDMKQLLASMKETPMPVAPQQKTPAAWRVMN